MKATPNSYISQVVTPPSKSSTIRSGYRLRPGVKTAKLGAFVVHFDAFLALLGAFLARFGVVWARFGISILPYMHPQKPRFQPIFHVLPLIFDFFLSPFPLPPPRPRFTPRR